jgi:hypothetical protein
VISSALRQKNDAYENASALAEAFGLTVRAITPS